MDFEAGKYYKFIAKQNRDRFPKCKEDAEKLNGHNLECIFVDLIDDCITVLIPDNIADKLNLLSYLSLYDTGLGFIINEQHPHLKQFLGKRAMICIISSNDLSEVSEIKLEGMNCNKCTDFYQYVTPNQLDNSFKCYGCRNGY